MADIPKSQDGAGGANLPQLNEAAKSLRSDLTDAKTALDNLLTKLDNDGALNDTDYAPSESASLTFSVSTGVES